MKSDCMMRSGLVQPLQRYIGPALTVQASNSAWRAVRPILRKVLMGRLTRSASELCSLRRWNFRPSRPCTEAKASQLRRSSTANWLHQINYRLAMESPTRIGRRVLVTIAKLTRSATLNTINSPTFSLGILMLFSPKLRNIFCSLFASST